MKSLGTFLSELKKEAAGMYIKNGAIVLDYRYPYQIELSRCNTPGRILGWAHQLASKTWMTPQRLDCFIQLAFKQIGTEVDYRI